MDRLPCDRINFFFVDETQVWVYVGYWTFGTVVVWCGGALRTALIDLDAA